MDRLADSRARVTRGVVRAASPVTGEIQNWIPTYCTNCGKPDGFISDTHALSVTCLCNDCVETWGVPAGLAKCGGDVWQERVEEATAGLSMDQIVAKLDEPESLLNKLANDMRRAAIVRS